MSELSAQTNAHLFYAQRLLKIEQNNQLDLGQQDINALYAGVSLCLRQSWESWLQELASYMGVAVADYSALLASPLNSLPEAQCLVSLNREAPNWLSRILDRSYGVTQHTNKKSRPTKASVSSSQIDVVLLDAASEPSEYDVLSQAIKEFKQYMESVRVRQVEW